jgi:hypothetical protein
MFALSCPGVIVIAPLNSANSPLVEQTKIQQIRIFFRIFILVELFMRNHDNNFVLNCIPGLLAFYKFLTPKQFIHFCDFIKFYQQF